MLTNIRNFIITLLVSALIFGTAAYFISDMVISSFSKDKDVIGKSTDTQGSVIDPSDDSEKHESADELFTALIIGTDYTKENIDYDLSVMNQKNEGFYYKERAICADSVFIISFNKTKKNVLISPISSDMYVSVNGVEMMLCKAFDAVGIDYFGSIVESLTGMHIDRYFCVSLDGFANVIDSIGGVIFDVPCNMKYADKSQRLDIDIKAGEQAIDGKTAVNMLRYVSYPEGNVSRMNVAESFAKTLISQVSSKSNYYKAAKLYFILDANVDTNFSIYDLTKNLDLFFSYDSFTVTDYTYPVISEFNESTGKNKSSPNPSKAYTYYRDFRTSNT